jgi:hypothetical protein
MKTPPLAARLSRAKYLVGKTLRRLGLEYSRDASVQMWREHGDRLLAQGRVDEAIDCRRKAQEFDPASRQLRDELVLALIRAGRADQVQDEAEWNASAERALRAAVARSSGGCGALLALSECLARQRQLSEAQAARGSWFQHWIEDGDSRHFRRHQSAACQRRVPAILLIAMMKSASEFIRENLMRALDVPELTLSIETVPRDKMVPSIVRYFAFGGTIARSHMSADNLPGLIANGVDRLILHVRDPRQVIVSWVHHMARISDVEFIWSLSTYDPPIPMEFRVWSFSKQLDWAIRNYMPGQIRWLEDWRIALEQNRAIPILLTKFEDFAEDQQAFFAKISTFLGVSEINLPATRQQSRAAVRNFRSGNTDEWRDVLTPKQICQINSRLAGVLRYFDWQSC